MLNVHGTVQGARVQEIGRASLLLSSLLLSSATTIPWTLFELALILGQCLG